MYITFAILDLVAALIFLEEEFSLGQKSKDDEVATNTCM